MRRIILAFLAALLLLPGVVTASASGGDVLSAQSEALELDGCTLPEEAACGEEELPQVLDALAHVAAAEQAGILDNTQATAWRNEVEKATAFSRIRMKGE